MRFAPSAISRSEVLPLARPSIRPAKMSAVKCRLRNCAGWMLALRLRICVPINAPVPAATTLPAGVSMVSRAFSNEMPSGLRGGGTAPPAVPAGSAADGFVKTASSRSSAPKETCLPSKWMQSLGSVISMDSMSGTKWSPPSQMCSRSMVRSGASDGPRRTRASMAPQSNWLMSISEAMPLRAR